MSEPINQPEALRLADILQHQLPSIECLERAAAELRRLHVELAAAEYALRSKGYRKSCEIPACNCGDQWSHGGNAEARLRELSSELHGSPVDMNGKTLLAGLSELVERAENAEAEVERLRAELARLTTLRPACEHDGESRAIWYDMAVNGVPVASALAANNSLMQCAGWTPLPDLKEPK